jgi:hypothetical protein
LRVDAPEGESLFVSWAAMITPWLFTIEPIVSDVRSVIVKGGTSEELTCSLEMPASLSPGRCHLVVCALVNGMVSLTSRYVDVATSVVTQGLDGIDAHRAAGRPPARGEAGEAQQEDGAAVACDVSGAHAE